MVHKFFDSGNGIYVARWLGRWGLCRFCCRLSTWGGKCVKIDGAVYAERYMVYAEKHMLKVFKIDGAVYVARWPCQ